MQNSQYRMQLLASDLQHEELIHQVAESLDQLKTVIDDVFSNVQTKIDTNKARLAKISDRTRLAQLKVDKLKGRKKATQVTFILFLLLLAIIMGKNIIEIGCWLFERLMEVYWAAYASYSTGG